MFELYLYGDFYGARFYSCVAQGVFIYRRMFLDDEVVNVMFEVGRCCTLGFVMGLFFELVTGATGVFGVGFYPFARECYGYFQEDVGLYCKGVELGDPLNGRVYFSFGDTIFSRCFGDESGVV